MPPARPRPHRHDQWKPITKESLLIIEVTKGMTIPVWRFVALVAALMIVIALPMVASATSKEGRISCQAGRETTGGKGTISTG